MPDASAILHCEDGHPALLRDAGTLTLCGWPDGDGWDRVLDAVGLDADKLAETLRKRCRGHLEFFVNYGDTTARYDGFEIPAAGVVVRDRQTGKAAVL